MSRTFGTRLTRIEREIGAPDADRISYLDALRIMRDRFSAIVASEGASPEERNDANEKLASLSAEVWGTYDRKGPKLSIIGALETDRVYERIVDPQDGDIGTPDWCAIAETMGLRIAEGDNDGGAFIRSGGRVRLIERIIVHPPKRDDIGRVIGEDSNVVPLH